MIPLEQSSIMHRNIVQLDIATNLIDSLVAPSQERKGPLSVGMMGVGFGAAEALSLRIELRKKRIRDDLVTIVATDNNYDLISRVHNRTLDPENITDICGNTLVNENDLDTNFIFEDSTWYVKEDLFYSITFGYEDVQTFGIYDILFFQNITPFFPMNYNIQWILNQLIKKVRSGGYLFLGGYDELREKSLSQMIARRLLIPCMESAREIHDAWLDRRSDHPKIVPTTFHLGKFVPDPTYCSMFRKV